MANSNRREALRGAEEETFDLIALVSTSEQWAELLRAPLESAAADGNRGLAQKLVGAGADIGDALHKAARGGHGSVVNDLLENGASVTAKDRNDRTPLHFAAYTGKTETVQLLLLKGSGKDAMDNFENTPLYLASQGGHVDAALALLAAGADISLRCSRFKDSAVLVAAQGGHVETLNVLIKHGADVVAVDAVQDTPLHRAVRYNRVEAISVLLEAGANTEARRGVGGRTPLHDAVFKVSLEAVLALLKHGVDVNAQDKDKNTSLHLAVCRTESTQVVDSLLRSGADETILNDEGKTAADKLGICIGYLYGEEDQLTEDVEHLRDLLANAPADRAWRRRGYLVLCRSHPDRMQQIYEISSACAAVARSPGSSADLARTETVCCTGTAGGSTVDGQTGGD